MAQLIDHRGGCHCGAIRISYSSALPAAEHVMRACQCSFCRKHNSLAASDPEGSAEITIADEAKVSRYRFGFGTADFIVCHDCGVYVAVVVTEGENSWSATIVNALDDRTAFSGPVEPVDLSAEEWDERLQRRRTPRTPIISVHA